MAATKHLFCVKFYIELDEEQAANWDSKTIAQKAVVGSFPDEATVEQID